MVIINKDTIDDSLKDDRSSQIPAPCEDFDKSKIMEEVNKKYDHLPPELRLDIFIDEVYHRAFESNEG